MKSADRVTVAWIDPGLVEGGFATSMIELFRARSSRLDGMVRVEGGLLSRQRNEVVKTFLDQVATQWLLMIDSDQTISVEAFDKLIAAAHEKERPVVAGLYFGTLPNPEGLLPTPVPHFYRRADDGIMVSPVVDYPTDELIEIDAAGTGCLLVHRSVLEKIRENAEPAEGNAWCWFRDLPLAGHWLGEDLYFCRRIRALGFPIWGHTGAILPHRRRYWLDERQHEAARAVRRKTVADQSAAEARKEAVEAESRGAELRSDERGFVKREVANGDH